jgi:hypothetical protein
MRCPSAANIDSAQAADLPAMIATLCSYDRLFGPCHVQTLSLAAHIAEVLRDIGEPQQARCLLERVVRDLANSGGRTHAKRISALHTLRDLMVEQSDIPGAVAVQTEISECRLLLAGPGAPETTTAMSDLEELLMLSSESTFEN